MPSEIDQFIPTSAGRFELVLAFMIKVTDSWERTLRLALLLVIIGLLVHVLPLGQVTALVQAMMPKG